MNTFPRPTIGYRLLQERKNRSWSQQTLANKISTTVQNINRWEHDKAIPQPHHRAKLCEVFEKSPDELFGEPEEEELPPIWNVPHLRNLYFTGRQDILTQLHTTLNSKKTVALSQPGAISGLGGIGKTQTAIEYAYRYGNDYKAVLWVRADSHEALISNFVALADVLKLPEKNEADQSRVVAAVKHWFQEHTQWLLILDNADDLEIVYDFLPARGHTLLTTRSQITGPNIKKIEIEKMSPEEGTLFLLRRAKLITEDGTLDDATEGQREGAIAIYELVDGLPLALDQAAAYIEENEYSLSDYLSLYQKQRTTLLQRRGTLSKRDYPRSVATTWSLSFEQVERDNPAAAELLRLCAFLHPDAIPEAMIIEGVTELGPILQPVVADPIEFAEAIGALRKYSLVRRNAETKTLTLHRLVQEALKDAMAKKKQREWAERAVKVVNQVFPHPEKIELWTSCQQHLPHAKVCAELAKQWDIELEEAALLHNKVGTYLRERALYAEAEPFLRRSSAIYEKLLGPEHLNVATSLNDLAELYHKQGQYSQEEPLRQHVLALRENTLGPQHSSVAESLNNLGRLYYRQGKRAEAEYLWQRALTIWENVPGSENLRAASSLNNLAVLYYTQGKHSQAETLLQRALTIMENNLVSEHPNIAAALNNLANCYSGQGKYRQAELLHQRALVILNKVFGPQHPAVVECLNGLAILYRKQGNHTHAEQLLQQALTVYEQVLGPINPNVAQVLNDLAQLHHDQDQHFEAEALYRRVLTIQEQCLGSEHPDLATTLENYAALLRKMDRETEAMPLEERAKVIREQRA